ncbi:hypothetical protein AYO50_00030 [Acidobacteria bacterium SCGC AG-212-P17]|nr:hypothetical protein AYO50_00030 [Acidobacteria bacterium SCGC AG-212-P17]
MSSRNRRTTHRYGLSVFFSGILRLFPLALKLKAARWMAPALLLLHLDLGGAEPRPRQTVFSIER